MLRRMRKINEGSRFLLLARSLIIGVVLLMSSGSATAGDMRCDGWLVSNSMTPGDVEKICGAPNEFRRREILVERTRTIRRMVSRPVGANGAEALTEVVDSETYFVPVQVDEWLYNRDPGEFVRLLIFEDGRLSKIHLLERAASYADKVGHILEAVPPYTPPAGR